MRRTVLTVLALTGTAVLMGTGPAFASGTTAPSPAPATAAPTARPAESAVPAPSAEPTRAPAEDQVSVRPSGAPDTGVTAGSQDSGSGGTAIGAGAAAVLALGGGTVLVVRRRRATGA
ncbi:sortase-dependent protein [Streptomyces sp. NPDC006132]|uniref:sortase-dependent protein n=1 Tax=Streptomyces sp. NPDC006132 TaxID=3156732 RepID=UPI0033FA9749